MTELKREVGYVSDLTAPLGPSPPDEQWDYLKHAYICHNSTARCF